MIWGDQKHFFKDCCRLQVQAWTPLHLCFSGKIPTITKQCGVCEGSMAEIGAMSKQLEEEQGNISVYTDRQTKVIFLPIHLL